MSHTISERLVKARKLARLTQKEVASQLGISTQGYFYYEHGDHAIKGETIKELSRILGVNPSYLLGVTDDPEPDFAGGLVTIPIYGEISAGRPLDSYLEEGQGEVPARLKKKYPNAFFLRVEGESMNRVLPNGCLALIDPDEKRIDHPNTPYALSVNGDTALIKRVRPLYNGFELIPDSTDTTYKPKVFDFAEEPTCVIAIIGRVVWFTMPDDWSF